MADGPADHLREQADLLAETRQQANFHPSIDGKLAEAEVNLRGVAGLLEARRRD